jgi:hypothetical protein
MLWNVRSCYIALIIVIKYLRDSYVREHVACGRYLYRFIGFVNVLQEGIQTMCPRSFCITVHASDSFGLKCWPCISTSTSLILVIRLRIVHSELGYWQRQMFLFVIACSSAQWLIQPLVQQLPVATSSEVRRPGCETGHSLPSTAGVQYDETVNLLSLPSHIL